MNNIKLIVISFLLCTALSQRGGGNMGGTAGSSSVGAVSSSSKNSGEGAGSTGMTCK